MKDIDFDELDKAVSSLLGSKDEQPAAAASVSTSVPVSVPVSATPEPVVTLPKPATTVPPTPAPATSSSPAGRRSGRFMDVVHPSSDMSQSDGEPARQPMVGSGRKLQPISRDVKPDPVELKEESAKADAPVPEKLAAVPDADPQTLVSTPDTTDPIWPDPLDVQIKDTPTATEPTPEAESDSPISDTPEPKSSSDAVSPFLSDTKVEKRPLGAYADQPKTEEPAVEEPAPAPKSPESLFDQPDTPLLEADDTQVPATPTAPSSEDMPPELDEKVVQVEATERGDKPDESATPVNIGATAATMSIPQQYKAEQRPSKDSEHSPFDTKEYHAPIPTPERKKTGMGQWIILGLLLVVALGGAAYWWLYLR